jgi:hypothetical protein
MNILSGENFGISDVNTSAAGDSVIGRNEATGRKIIRH